MNKKNHIIITAIIALIVFIFSPQIYVLPVFEYNMFEQRPRYEFTEQLKEDNQMKWVCRMQNIEARAREIVNTELVYV